MLELEVHRTFCRWQPDLVDVLCGRNVVNLGNVLPDKDVEELLGEVVSSIVPGGRVDLSERMEFLGRSLLFGTSFLSLSRPLRIVLDTKVDTQERRNATSWLESPG